MGKEGKYFYPSTYTRKNVSQVNKKKVLRKDDFSVAVVVEFNLNTNGLSRGLGQSIKLLLDKVSNEIIVFYFRFYINV